jgi:tetratricopeptide (TPR) repeat protein
MGGMSQGGVMSLYFGLSSLPAPGGVISLSGYLLRSASLNNLASLYKSQGKYNQAEPLYQQALALLQKLLGDDHPDVAFSLNNLAELYYSQGKYKEAEPLYEQALNIFEQRLGVDHPHTIIVRGNLEHLRNL